MALVRVEQRGAVGTITFNRPAVLNALSRDMYAELNAAMRTLEADENIRAIVFIGADGDFCSGADTKEIAAVRDSPDRSRLDEIFRLDFLKPLTLTKPTIAAIDGYCVGEGFAIAQACDIRICTPGAKFMLPEAKLGIPAVSLPLLASRTLHANYALELLLTGEVRDARWALRSGFINGVVQKRRLAVTASSMAATIAHHPAAVIRMMKQLVYRSFEQDYDSASEHGLAQRKKFLDGTV